MLEELVVDHWWGGSCPRWISRVYIKKEPEKNLPECRDESSRDPVVLFFWRNLSIIFISRVYINKITKKNVPRAQETTCLDPQMLMLLPFGCRWTCWDDWGLDLKFKVITVSNKKEGAVKKTHHRVMPSLTDISSLPHLSPSQSLSWSPCLASCLWAGFGVLVLFFYLIAVVSSLS